MILNILSSIIQNQTNRFKINYSLGYVLSNIETDQFRYYHLSHNNAQVLDTAVLISSAEELGEFLHNISEENFRDTLSRPDTRWKFVQLTNITFYVYKLKDAPLGAPISLPDFLRFNRGLANVPGNDNLCFFRCLAVHKGVNRKRCELKAVVAEPLINIFILVFCLRCPVVGTCRSLQWAVLHNEQILQDKRNLITVSLFSLFFVCLLYIYTAASLC